MKNAGIRPFGGFTLIELLVVILIIGILASVSLPQYEKAVFKSRYSAMIPLVKTLAAAQESYFMANGHYTTDFSELDVEIPSSFTPTSKTYASFGGSVYANADESIYVGMAMDNANIMGVQFFFPEKHVGYRIAFQNGQIWVGDVKKGVNYCIEMNLAWNQYCSWLVNSPTAVVLNWWGRWYPIES